MVHIITIIIAQIIGEELGREILGSPRHLGSLRGIGAKISVQRDLNSIESRNLRNSNH